VAPIPEVVGSGVRPGPSALARARHQVSVHVPELDEVLRMTYASALFERRQRPYFRRSHLGSPVPRPSAWAFDFRVPLARSELLQPIGRHMAHELGAAGLSQVAGYGYGSYGLVGAIVAQSANMTGAFIREARKPYGFCEVIEGDLHRDAPVIVVDDLLGRGRSSLQAAMTLRSEGFRVTGVYTVFRMGWRPGRDNLRAAGLSHRCLATLTSASR
jgi:orotate phosphoribosyltransferase